MSEFTKALKKMENIKDNRERERIMASYVIDYLRTNECCISTENWIAIVNHNYDPWCLIDEITEYWTDYQKRDVMFTWAGQLERVKLNLAKERITEPFMFWPEGTLVKDITDAMEEFFGINTTEEEDNEVTKEVSYVFENGEQADVYRHDNNDYSVYFHNGDCSVRGSLWEIMDEVKECEAKSRVAEKEPEEDYEHTAMTSCGTYMNLWTTGGDYDCYVKFHEAEDKEKVDAATFATEDICHHIMQNEYLKTEKKKELIENLLDTYIDYGVAVTIIEKGAKFNKEEVHSLGEVIFDMTLAVNFMMPEDADIDSRDIYNDIFEWANEFEKGRIDNNNNKYYISLDDFIRNKIMEEYPDWFD